MGQLNSDTGQNGTEPPVLHSLSVVGFSHFSAATRRRSNAFEEVCNRKIILNVTQGHRKLRQSIVQIITRRVAVDLGTRP